MKILLAGCGALGRRLGETLSASGDEVLGIKRQATDAAFPMLSLDLSDKQAVDRLPTDVDVIVFTVTPDSYDDAGYRHVYETVLGHLVDRVKRCSRQPLFLLVSSTGVYGQQDGERVDENSETQPTSTSGRWVLYGEQLLQSQLDHHLVVRLSGIYGPNRRYLIDKAMSGQPIQQNPTLWTNRIHEDDCVDALAFLINRYRDDKALDTVYLVSDDAPVGLYDVVAYICQQAGRALPPIKTDDLSYALNKRCDNTRIKALGYQFRYPSYREGYGTILASEK